MAWPSGEVTHPDWVNLDDMSVATAFGRRALHDYDEAYADGYAAGYADGYAAGHADGYDEGYDDGYAVGYAAGYADGLAAGGAPPTTGQIWPRGNW